MQNDFECANAAHAAIQVQLWGNQDFSVGACLVVKENQE